MKQLFCKRGHPRTPENVYGTNCKLCREIWEQTQLKATCHPDRPRWAKGLCLPCYNKQRYHTHKEQSRLCGEVMTLRCSHCNEPFLMRASVWRWRMKVRKDKERFYCCGSHAQIGRGTIALRRDPSWTDEQWEWEQRLSAEGLRMGRAAMDIASPWAIENAEIGVGA